MTDSPWNAKARAMAVKLMRTLGMEPDPWQLEVLAGGHPRLLLNCCRQAGKSTAVAVLALAEALFLPASKILLLSRSHRQAQELYRLAADCYRRLRKGFDEQPEPRLTADEMLLNNGSRIVCLPCREETIRGYSHVTLLIIDEAARVPDELYRAVRPMLAVSDGRLICLSTPYGRRGFFYEAWANGGDDWKRIEVPAFQIPRIKPEFLEEERRQTSESWFRQEYGCSFEALEGLVYPDFARCVVPSLPAHLGGNGSVALRRTPYGQRLHLQGTGKKLGGLDFGFRNPFAAVWGLEDGDGVLWLTGEHYERGKPLSHHARFLPHDVLWYADPSGAQERAELRCADFTVREGVNALSLGIMAVATRLEQGTLRVLEGRCPNLLYEAGLYRYGDEPGVGREAPLDEHNHALAALRYLIASLDRRRLAKAPRGAGAPSASAASPAAPAKPAEESERAEQERLRRAQREYLLGDGPHWHYF